jgi:hypothetical protein
VFKEQQYIPSSLCNPVFLELFLKCICLAIGHQLGKLDKCTHLRERLMKRLIPLG